MASKAYYTELAQKSLRFAMVVTDLRLADRLKALAAEYHGKAMTAPEDPEAAEPIMPPPLAPGRKE
jgi:hypothetical protein